MTDRYLRHHLIDWFDQDFIRNLNVLIVGAGAVGNEVIKNLALLGVGKMCIVDMDKIEIHNLTRSALFTEADVGKYKAEVASNAVRHLDPNCQITSICGDFWSSVSFELIRHADVVFCCVDNFEARIKINLLCNLLDTDLINTGIDSRFVAAELYSFNKDEASACYECSLPLTTYHRLSERFSCGYLKKVAFIEKKIPTTVITASYAGAIASSLFLYAGRDESGRGAVKVFLDTVTSTTSRNALTKNPDCPCCSAHSKNKTVIKANRTVSAHTAFATNTELDRTVQTSDPILVSWNLPDCDICREATAPYNFINASECDDSIANCPRCGQGSRLPIVQDQFTVRELMENHAGRLMPCKFISYHDDANQIFVEFTD